MGFNMTYYLEPFFFLEKKKSLKWEQECFKNVDCITHK